MNPACPTCDGAGFFGNGPYVEFCAYCHGTGEIIDESDRKPVERERRKIPGKLKIAGGDHADPV
jgi:DnaJ-class molecular chaperone